LKARPAVTSDVPSFIRTSRRQAARFALGNGGRLREHGPLYFSTHAQGYWIFTRYDAVRDMYKNPEIFSSESITPSDEPIYRFVPTQVDHRTTSSTGAS
jgi:hypothetical protein